MAFSPVSSAFAGFKLIGRSPGVFAIWILAYVLMGLGAVALMFLMGASTFMRFAGLAATAKPDPSAVMGMLGTILLVMVVMVPLLLLINAVMGAAIMRAVLRPEQNALAYLRLGADELRLVVVMLVFGLLAFLYYLVCALVLSAVSIAAGQAAVIVAIVGGVVMLLALLYFFARLSLAYPMTLVQKRIKLFDSWGVSAPKGMQVFGMWIIILLSSLVIGLITLLVTRSMMGLPIGLNMFNPQAMQAARPTGGMPMLILTWVIQVVVSTVQVAMIFAPQAEAYRALVGSEAVADAF
jgi:hypothetical protein